MKIISDLQACQSLPHKDRGIGRYSRALAAAMHRVGDGHEILYALNAVIPETIEATRSWLPPQAEVLSWSGLRDTGAHDPANRSRRAVAAAIRDAAFAARRPGVVHISSFFEGHIDDTVVDIPRIAASPSVVTLYDLIPLVHSGLYLADESLNGWYMSRIEELKRADMLLAISGSTRAEAIDCLGFPSDRVVNISSAVDPMFRPMTIAPEAEMALRRRHGLAGRFILYTGGIDQRKNIDRLIEAFGGIDEEIRRDVQLAIVCSVSPETAQALRNRALLAGLPPQSLVLTGFVPDQDLMALYNICEGFVFPSWHEGFGLPVLEAMSCGAPAIASDRSSLPEVVGRADALFDPFDVRDMGERIARLIADSGFRAELREHGLARSRTFSWEASARVALDAFGEAASRVAPARVGVGVAGGGKPSLAFVSPLPPERSGISNYSAELLPGLEEHYEVTLVVDQASVEAGPEWAHLPVRDPRWFEEHAAGFDRIVFQFGNSPFHCHMFGLLEKFGGAVVLHDFFLSGVVSHMEWASKQPGFWTESLYYSHGYPALVEMASGTDPEDMLLRYPCNGRVIEDADGVIVHSQHARDLARQVYGGETGDGWRLVPHLRRLPPPFDRGAARAALGIREDEFVVCSFGILGPGKLNHVLLEGWMASQLASDEGSRLFFVGQAHDPAYADGLLSRMESDRAGARVAITGYVDNATYALYLQAADIAVQLRQNSRGETSGAVLDCLAHGVATVANAHGSMGEMGGAVMLLPDSVRPQDLKDALERLRVDGTERDRLREAGIDHCRSTLDPKVVAASYREAIEGIYAESGYQRARALGEDLSAPWAALSEGDRRSAADAFSSSIPRALGVRQLLVDVTELVRRDAKSGIQRVVRSILLNLLGSPVPGWRIEPVYADRCGGYRYARKFTLGLLGLGANSLADDPVAAGEGDIFLGLDLALEEIPAEAGHLAGLRDRGVKVYVVVYDVLPLKRNDCFPPHAEALYRRWLTSFVEVGDGAICISRSVADELSDELDALDVRRERPFRIDYFHLGADIDESLPTVGVEREERDALDGLEGARSFLMVGTVEPRKGHAQAIDGFDLLWSRGRDSHLVIVGKPGWMTAELVERIRQHDQYGSKLIWFERASDELLGELYGRCSALLAASEGEGFGLPVIEAAKHGLPVIARDIPVFREVAGDGAYFFSGFEPEDVYDAVTAWTALADEGRAPVSGKVNWLTWSQSASELLRVVRSDKEYGRWLPGSRRYVPAHDTRNEVGPGGRVRGAACLPEHPDLVLRSGPLDIPAGTHLLRLEGSLLVEGALRLVVERGDGSPLLDATLRKAADPDSSVLSEWQLCLEMDSPGLRVVVWSDGRARGEVSGVSWIPVAHASFGSGEPTMPAGADVA